MVEQHKQEVVMKIEFYVCFILVISLSSIGLCDSTEIKYNIADLGADRWQYSYEVSNNTLSGSIEEFTIWFDFGSYENLVIETDSALSQNWDEIVWQPDSVLGDAGGYDVLKLTSGIEPGQSISGFSVSFDWIEQGVPSSQYYEIINPSTFQIIDSGFTIPEPATILLFAVTGFIISHKSSRNFG